MENKMFCPWCKHKVTEAQGICNTCSKHYDCLPSLKTGDTVEYMKASEYETDKIEKQALITLAKKYSHHFWNGLF